jgi:hypothetical protein
MKLHQNFIAYSVKKKINNKIILYSSDNQNQTKWHIFIQICILFFLKVTISLKKNKKIEEEYLLENIF